MQPTIRDAESAADIEIVRDLFREYQGDIGVDLCFQGFADELAGLPGKYARPGGRLLLAFADDTVAGCVALRPLEGSDCEMKRLYVRPTARGRGLGRMLATAIVAAGRTAGYRRMLLDTLSSMTEAIALYRSLGFVEVPPYCHNPLAEALYFRLTL